MKQGVNQDAKALLDKQVGDEVVRLKRATIHELVRLRTGSCSPRDWQKRRALTDSQVAAMLGVSRGTWIRYRTADVPSRIVRLALAGLSVYRGD